ncbi:hypothetical protein [Tenacibaculum soleae]|uniref:hypothetical protein n=1 Tax=Tenacibaculum soleae TaxID=447689 RepID=UPI002301692D|nr:hypothetical protein [Tenacibaculum soleae]
MAKHWKQFIKQEEPTKKSVKNEDIKNKEFSLSNLIQPATNDKSLKDIAASNVNLKSLLEEQKELEQNMNALTGKTEEHSSTNKSYDTEIKSVYQKRKEEYKEAKKKQKTLERRKNKVKENSNLNRKEKDFFNVDFIEKTQKKATKTLSKKENKKEEFSTKKKQSKTKLKTFYNVKKTAKKVTNISSNTLKNITKVDKNLAKFSEKLIQVNEKKTKIPEELKKITKTINNTSKTIKKVNTVANNVSQSLNKISDLLSNNLNTQKETSINNSFSKTIKTISTITKTAEKTIDTFNKIDKKKTVFVKNVQQNGFKTPLPSKKNNTENTNALNKNLNKVNNFYKTSKKHLNKTNTTVNSLFNNYGKLKKLDNNEKASLELNSLDKIFNKKEEKASKGFNTINISEIFSAAKKIKKFADELPIKKETKSTKDPFSF